MVARGVSTGQLRLGLLLQFFVISFWLGCKQLGHVAERAASQLAALAPRHWCHVLLPSAPMTLPGAHPLAAPSPACVWGLTEGTGEYSPLGRPRTGGPGSVEVRGMLQSLCLCQCWPCGEHAVELSPARRRHSGPWPHYSGRPSWRGYTGNNPFRIPGL